MIRLLNMGGRGEIGFVAKPEGFSFPAEIRVSYPHLRLIWGRYRLWSRNLQTYRWVSNCRPPDPATQQKEERGT